MEHYGDEKAVTHPTTPMMTAKRKAMTTTQRKSPKTGPTANMLPKPSVNRLALMVLPPRLRSGN
jgi:hypothetical protein